MYKIIIVCETTDFHQSPAVFLFQLADFDASVHWSVAQGCGSGAACQLGCAWRWRADRLHPAAAKRSAATAGMPASVAIPIVAPVITPIPISVAISVVASVVTPIPTPVAQRLSLRPPAHRRQSGLVGGVGQRQYCGGLPHFERWRSQTAVACVFAAGFHRLRRPFGDFGGA